MPREVCPSGIRRATFQGDLVVLKLAIVPVGIYNWDPSDMTVTVSGDVAKGATSITVTATTEKMYKGQALTFVDTTGYETLAILSADAEVGASSLTVYEIPELIPDGATANFPVKLAERSSVNYSASANTAETQTGDSAGEMRMIVSGFAAKTVSTDGVFTYKNAGYETCRNCFASRERVFVRIQYPAPNPQYTTGLERNGFFVVNSLGNDASADSQITAPVELTSDGGVCEVDPVPVP